jgi:hypothetical protein
MRFQDLFSKTFTHWIIIGIFWLVASGLVLGACPIPIDLLQTILVVSLGIIPIVVASLCRDDAGDRSIAAHEKLKGSVT